MKVHVSAAHLLLCRLQYQRLAALLSLRNEIRSKVKPDSTAPAPPLTSLPFNEDDQRLSLFAVAPVLT
ncbi:hypothetical protein T10_1324 [Trichinella papuae]|uniref:Uncharacterized protein n=1 Tax=Trichinella papuae TaxID=268474 RepID=A0A0V1M2X8_9BILA|nr:hypothetical protein T10_9445 [Trichinella papuae]KRZ66490.1 hypothetical protein T10_1324 [Trichinella papuae]